MKFSPRLNVLAQPWIWSYLGAFVVWLAAIVFTRGYGAGGMITAALALAVSRLADDTEMRLELGRRAREFAESNFERNAVLGTMFGALEQAVPGIVNDVAA